MADNRLAIGVDIGGTKIAFTLIDSAGVELATHRLPTQPDDGAERMIDAVAEGIGYLMAKGDGRIAGIGIGCPGHVDPESGTVRNAVNLNWTQVALRDDVKRRLGSRLPVFLHKDANASAMGELYFGAARGCKDFLILTIGTGLGGGAVVDGEVVIGANAFAMEVGHITFAPQGRLCKCGLHGCPEMYVSGNGLLAGIHEYRGDFPDSPLAHKLGLSTQMILEAARAKDPLAQLVMDEAARWLGTVIAYYATMLNPSLVIIGGGLGEAALDLLKDGALEEVRRRTLPTTYETLEIVKSQVTSSAVGAACLVWHALR